MKKKLGKVAQDYVRKLSATERVYLIYNDLCPPFANQMVLEGHGVLDSSCWVPALERASAANPGSRLILKGCLGFRRLVDSGKTPRLREVDGSMWDGLGPEGAPFLMDNLSPWDATGCEVTLIHGHPSRVAFRTHHSIMDARGTMLWAQDIFRELRGERAMGSDSQLTEPELARSFQKKGRTPPPHEFIAPTGRAEGNEPGVIWRRFTLSGRYHHLLAKIAVLMAEEARSRAEGKVRIAVPVDMRPRREGLRSTGNLTNLIYLDILPHATVEEITGNISIQLQQSRDGMLYWADSLIRFLPLWLIRRAVVKEIATKSLSRRYRNSGILSNPGCLSPEKFTGGGFSMETGFFIPPSQESLPIFIAMSGTTQRVEIVCSLPKVLATNGRLDVLIERIKTGLNKD